MSKPRCTCGALIPVTVDEAIEIQQKQIAELERWVKPEAIAKLRQIVQLDNDYWKGRKPAQFNRASCGHDIIRGQALVEWIQNNFDPQ